MGSEIFMHPTGVSRPFLYSHAELIWIHVSFVPDVMSWDITLAAQFQNISHFLTLYCHLRASMVWNIGQLSGTCLHVHYGWPGWVLSCWLFSRYWRPAIAKKQAKRRIRWWLGEGKLQSWLWTIGGGDRLPNRSCEGWGVRVWFSLFFPIQHLNYKRQKVVKWIVNMW